MCVCVCVCKQVKICVEVGVELTTFHHPGNPHNIQMQVAASVLQRKFHTNETSMMPWKMPKPADSERRHEISAVGAKMKEKHWIQFGKRYQEIVESICKRRKTNNLKFEYLLRKTKELFHCCSKKRGKKHITLFFITMIVKRALLYNTKVQVLKRVIYFFWLPKTEKLSILLGK